MRTRFGWLIVFALIALALCAGCSNNDNHDVLFGASDPLLRSLFIGTVAVKNGESVNVPLDHTNSIRFEFNRPVSPESLGTVLDFSIRIENVDKGTTALLTDTVLDENGELVWTDGTDKNVEFRMTHNMSYVDSGGSRYVLGEVGDRFRIHVDFVIGKSADGKNFSFWGDEFFVVWTSSSAWPSD
jgi:hypothetical protein